VQHLKWNDSIKRIGSVPKNDIVRGNKIFNNKFKHKIEDEKQK